MKIVSFKNRYCPESLAESRKHPAIVGTVDSFLQRTSLCHLCRKLTKEGFITLTFGASLQGRTGGELRFLEDSGNFSFWVDLYSDELFDLSVRNTLFVP